MQACNGPDVENVNGRCQPKVTGCVGPSVEVDASGNCVAKVDKFIETYLDKVAAKLQDDADAMSAEVRCGCVHVVDLWVMMNR